MDEYGIYIHKSRYARYRDDLGRRETWPETVKRYCDFWQGRFGDKFPYDQIYGSIVNLEVMPSMRALMSAGPALDRDNMAGYNCSYVTIDSQRSFDEIMYILLCGTGVGFSVERQYVSKLPEVPEELHESDTTIVVADSKIGWAAAFRELLSLLYSGQVPKWDVSRIRPAGARLKIFGGRASGPEPLVDLFEFTTRLFKESSGTKLSSIKVHDLVCKIADVVVVGGVRRSALISLSNLTDERMRVAKSGAWNEHDPQRALANNSVAYTEKPDIGIFMKEWSSLYESKSGERGIFNRVSARIKSEANGRREHNHEFGTNPCGEIILRPSGLCNLSEVILRSGDSYTDIKRKVEIATIIGTFQATLTDFRYVRPIWKKNAEEERLLGVSFTGIMDHPLFSGTKAPDNQVLSKILEELKYVAIETNKDWSARLGITPSVAITTVKPSGTVSQLVGSSSGIHPRHSPFYIRTIRADKKDPLAMFMRKMGFPVEDDLRKPLHTDVFSFPVRSPPGSVYRDARTALAQLEHYLSFKDFWCEHNPSITVYIRELEWIDVSAWVYKHFNDIGGIAFLPYDGGQYKQAPYQECTEEEYNDMEAKMPKDVPWEEFKEEGDQTSGMQELACFAAACEVN